MLYFCIFLTDCQEGSTLCIFLASAFKCQKNPEYVLLDLKKKIAGHAKYVKNKFCYHMLMSCQVSLDKDSICLFSIDLQRKISATIQRILITFSVYFSILLNKKMVNFALGFVVYKSNKELITQVVQTTSCISYQYPYW